MALLVIAHGGLGWFPPYLLGWRRDPVPFFPASTRSGYPLTGRRIPRSREGRGLANMMRWHPAGRECPVWDVGKGSVARA